VSAPEANFWRITGGPRCGYGYVVEFVPEQPPDDGEGWGQPLVTRQVAVTKTKKAALAVLRLCEVTEFHDWTARGANWDMPMTRL
jgi:hypothetical protein